MSNTPMRDKPIGTGTWLVLGGAVLGLGLLLFSGAQAASSVIVVRAPGRQVQMPGGSTPQNLALLVAAFGPNVHDLGNGVYAVSVASDVTASVTPGAKVL